MKGFPMRGLFEGWHFVILALVVVALFGYKKMPDAARSIGRSMRIFKSEMDEMKKDERPTPSAASSDTVKGETVGPTADPTRNTAPAARETHNQPPA